MKRHHQRKLRHRLVDLRSRHAPRAISLLQLRVLWLRDGSFGGEHRSEACPFVSQVRVKVIDLDLLRVLYLKTPSWEGLVDLFLSRHLGSRRGRCAISMAIAHPAAQLGGRLFWGTPRDHGEWELKMRDRVFLQLQGRVTVVAILFPSVLTAHALFHMNEDPMCVLMLNPPPPPPPNTHNTHNTHTHTMPSCYQASSQFLVVAFFLEQKRSVVSNQCKNGDNKTNGW